jgi:conjugal transfer pilus assembly protein TraK
MNTISTNLTMLTAKTNDEYSSFEIDEGYLYVTVSSTNPISLVLYEEGVLDSQVSITLVPVPAPPTIAKVNFALTPAMQERSAQFQKEMKLEQQMGEFEPLDKGNNPHTARLIDILRPVAMGDIPRGFGLTPDIPNTLRHPCMMTIYHRAEQRMVSGNHIIDVVLVKNDTDKPYNVREEMCLTTGTLAVALFEKAYLQPGDESELYIVRDKQLEQVEMRRQRRPRLTGGN